MIEIWGTTAVGDPGAAMGDTILDSHLLTGRRSTGSARTSRRLARQPHSTDRLRPRTALAIASEPAAAPAAPAPKACRLLQHLFSRESSRLAKPRAQPPAGAQQPRTTARTFIQTIRGRALLTRRRRRGERRLALRQNPPDPPDPRREGPLMLARRWRSRWRFSRRDAT